MLSSYLLNRSQVVKIENNISSAQNLSFGIAQGSIIGTLMFLIYIDNIDKIGLLGHLTLYADDTCLFYFDSCVHSIVTDAQTDLNRLNEWLKYNLLTVNTSKISFMIFSSKNKQIPQHTSLTIDNEEIHRSNQEKYLGLWLDEKLTWKPHIEGLKTKLISVLGAVRNISNYIPKRVSSIIYNSLVKSHLEYLIEIWGSAAATHLKSLQRIQNKIIKVLFHYKYSTPTTELFHKTEISNIKNLYMYYCILVKKIITGSVQTNIQLEKKTSSYNFRNRNKLQLIHPRN